MPIINLPAGGVGGGGSKAIVGQLTVAPANWSNAKPYTCALETLTGYAALGIKSKDDAVYCTIVPQSSTYLGDVESFPNISSIDLSDSTGSLKLTATCNEVRPSATMVLQFTVFPA